MWKRRRLGSCVALTGSSIVCLFVALSCLHAVTFKMDTDSSEFGSGWIIFWIAPIISSLIRTNPLIKIVHRRKSSLSLVFGYKISTLFTMDAFTPLTLRFFKPPTLTTNGKLLLWSIKVQIFFFLGKKSPNFLPKNKWRFVIGLFFKKSHRAFFFIVLCGLSRIIVWKKNGLYTSGPPSSSLPRRPSPSSIATSHHHQVYLSNPCIFFIDFKLLTNLLTSLFLHRSI